MSTLVAQVRQLAGATESDATDARIIEALNQTSVRVFGVEVEWLRLPSGAHSRVGRINIGAYRVEATGATGSVEPVVMSDATGDTLTDLDIDQEGYVATDAESGSLPRAFATGRVFDLHAAAVVIVDDMLAASRGAFDFTRGDQSFKRSQSVGNLQGLRDRLARKVIPRHSGEVGMSDQAAASC